MSLSQACFSGLTPTKQKAEIVASLATLAGVSSPSALCLSTRPESSWNWYIYDAINNLAGVDISSDTFAPVVGGPSTFNTFESVSRIETIETTISGSTGNQVDIVLAVPALGVTNARFVLLLPTTSGITVNFRSLLIGNSPLATFVTDTSGTDAYADFTYDGTNWNLTSADYIE